MSYDDAADFLRKLDTDPALRAKVAEGYRRLLIENGRAAGFTFTEDELTRAARAFGQGTYREVSDADLAMISGGTTSLYNVSFV